MNKKPSTTAFLKKGLSPKSRHALLILLFIYIAAIFTPVISPFARFPLYIVGCGKLPVIASGYSRSYRTPNDGQVYGVSVLTESFYCSEADAKAAGYKPYGSN